MNNYKELKRDMEDGTIDEYAKVPKKDADNYFANKKMYEEKYGKINPGLGER